MKNKIDNLSVKEIEALLHQQLLKEIGIEKMSFKKAKPTIWQELGVDQI